MLDEQAPALEEHARRFHGDSLLWAGCHSALLETVRGCMVRNRFLAIPDDSTADGEQSCVCCDLQALPFPNHSLDAIVLHHTLETVTDARATLREVSRVLVPGGRLVICAFNPVSAWGIRLGLGRVFKDELSGLKPVSVYRLIDWLTVLGFELQEPVRYLTYGLPFTVGESPQRIGRVLGRALRRWQVPTGGVYLVSATKPAYGKRLDWKPDSVRSPKLAPVAYPKLSAWNRIER